MLGLALVVGEGGLASILKGAAMSISNQRACETLVGIKCERPILHEINRTHKITLNKLASKEP